MLHDSSLHLFPKPEGENHPIIACVLLLVTPGRFSQVQEVNHSGTVFASDQECSEVFRSFKHIALKGHADKKKKKN